MAQFSGERNKRSPSPLIVKSPSIPDIIDDDLSTHIYAYIDKTRKQLNVGNKDQDVGVVVEAPPLKREESPKTSPPPPPIPPFNPQPHVYAKVSKTDSVEEEPTVLVNKAPPPVPRPYCPPTENIPTNDSLETTPTDLTPPIIVTQSGSKYKHLLKKTLPPPSHTPPPPPLSLVTPPTNDNTTTTPSIDIKRTRHDYEQIDFDNPNSYSSSSSSPATSLTTQSLLPAVTKGKRELKPKDRPAPPPPFKKRGESIDHSKSNTLEVVS